jgi:hypothetical protein
VVDRNIHNSESGPGPPDLSLDRSQTKRDKLVDKIVIVVDIVQFVDAVLHRIVVVVFHIDVVIVVVVDIQLRLGVYVDIDFDQRGLVVPNMSGGDMGTCSLFSDRISGGRAFRLNDQSRDTCWMTDSRYVWLQGRIKIEICIDVEQE